jgi:uncharacterized protein YjbI with pentapeptide repeats
MTSCPSSAEPPDDWERCRQPGCRGARLSDGDCLEHVPEKSLGQVLSECKARYELDARGVRITSALLRQILSVLHDDKRELQDGWRARDQRGPQLKCLVRFNGASFVEGAHFVGVTFGGPAFFDGARFECCADFSGTIFDFHADFDRVIFGAATEFVGAAFGDHVGFQDAVFDGQTTFDRAVFRGYVDLERALFRRDASFREATFQEAYRIGPLAVGDLLQLDDCRFSSRVTLEGAAKRISARAASFADGVWLSVRNAEIALDNADFARASTLTRATTWSLSDEWRGDDVTPAGDEVQPQLVTLRGAQVADLALSGLDLRVCRFLGSHGLECIRIESSCRWPHVSRRWRIDRETIAEELDVRGGSDRDTTPPAWLGKRNDARELNPGQVAAIYRALRKAREDHKDQCGAGDLYYGEMEMRRRIAIPARFRRGRLRARAERAIIRLYWLLSGYGLRAGRAFVALTGVVVLAAVGLHACGFKVEVSYSKALLLSVKSATGLLRVTPVDELKALTLAGEVTEVVLRLIGPLLIGLWLLALRAGVKR